MNNACFVIDRSQLKNSDDWLVTDLGSFENRGSSARIYVIQNDKIVRSWACKGTQAERNKLGRGEFLVRNVFERHRKHTDFMRNSTLVYSCGGQALSLGMIQYSFMGEEHPVSPHKHPRSGKKFIPTAPSTKAKLLEEATGRKGPSRIYDDVSEAVGGMLDCELSSELPRNSKQVQNARQRVASKAQEDEFATLLELAKEDKTVHNLQWTPSPRVVFYHEDQIDDILRDCCSPESKSILSIDTTFNVGNFYLTSTTYQSKKVLNKKTGKPANLPGPAMFHTSKSGNDFLYFIHTLLECSYELERVAFVGGDRDKAQASFLKPLKGCTFLPCKKHVEDDITRKIADLGLSAVRKEILEDIFGSDSKLEKGIIDSESGEEFLAKVESVSAKWDKLEEDITKEDPRFSRYFQRHVEEDMKNGMLLPVRRKAGLNDEFFYNNVQESWNAVFKGKIKEKKVLEGIGYRPELKCTWSEAIKLYKHSVLNARRDIQRAVLGKGPFSLNTQYQYLTVTDARWSIMSRQDRQKHLETLGAAFEEEAEDEDADTTYTSSVDNDHLEVMGKFENSGLPEFLRGSWSNAGQILSLEGIVPYPNSKEKHLVISLSRPISHTVEVKARNLTCSECPRYNERGICAHTLAVAHQLGRLQEYTKSYQVPLANMVAPTIPNGAGKKENEKKSRKRKSNSPRVVANYGNRVEAETFNEEAEDLSLHEVVFIVDTKATTCYGCKGHVRNNASDPPPPAPHNIFLRHREHRVFKRRGETKIRISKTPESVYYHPLRSCAPSASSMNIKLEESVVARLSESNKQLLWREFGVRFN